MKNISIKVRVLIYIGVFIVAAAATFLIKIGITGPEEETSSTMGSAVLPIVYMQTENDIKYNYLHGYTCDVDQKLLHDAVTPIGSDRNMSIYIKQYGSVISGISYELRSLDGTELVERNDVSDYDSEDGVVKASFKFRNLMDAGKEYMLKINIGTEQYGQASYYTRIVIMDDAETDRKLEYVKNFSEYTMDEDSLDKITAKLETDSTGDNTNLGRVNIHSKLSQVGFGGISPEAVTDRYITVNEIDGTTASVTVNYTAETTDETGQFLYNIKEFYRINQPDETVTYVYSYDRWMDQIFDPDYGVSSTGELYLGICSDDDIEIKSDSSGKNFCFVRENRLWKFNSSKNEFVKIFDFAQSDGNDLRENYGEHDIKILDVDDEGNVKFLVYGYMNRGIHEGKVGISVFSYDSGENTTTEIIFIPRTDPYMSIALDIDTLAYINENNIIYMYSGGTIYYLDCSTKECMVVADNVLTDACIMSDESGMLIYQTGDDAYDCDIMYIMLLETGEKYQLAAEDGKKIKALGFVDGNVVFGEASADMIYVDSDGNVSFPMDKITLMNSEYKVVREYSKSGVYVTDVRLGDGQIAMKRARLDDDGSLVTTSDDRLLSSSEETESKFELNERITEARQKEKYISLSAGGDAGKISDRVTNYVFASDAEVNISSAEQTDKEIYYVYGYGCLYKVCGRLSEAMEAASESGGVVIDSDARTIWTRYKSSEKTLSIPENAVAAADDTQAAATDLLLRMSGSNKSSQSLYQSGFTTIECMEELLGNAVNLTGSSIDNALYFVDKGYPLIAKTGPGIYQLVYGYSASNVSAVDFTTGTTQSYTKAEFDNMIGLYGSVLITAEF